MDNPRSNPTGKPPSPDDRQRTLELAAVRAWRSARLLLVLAVLIPFVTYQAFHVTVQTAVLMHLGLAALGWRSGWQWLMYRRALNQTRAPATDRTLPSSRSRRGTPGAGSYPSRLVRVIEASGAVEWATITRDLVMQDLLGSFDDRPVYQWVKLDDRWYRYETVDSLAAPINDQEHHLLLGGLRYRRLPEDHPGPEDAIAPSSPAPLA